MQPKPLPGIVYIKTDKFVTDGHGKRYRVVEMVRDVNFKYLPQPKYK